MARDRAIPTEKQKKSWEKFVKDLPRYNPCTRCNKMEADLRKVAEKWRNGPPYPRDPDKLAIWQGECNCADELDKLLEGRGE